MRIQTLQDERDLEIKQRNEARRMQTAAQTQLDHVCITVYSFAYHSRDNSYSKSLQRYNNNTNWQMNKEKLRLAAGANSLLL